MKTQGLPIHENGRQLAEGLNRSPDAIRTRLQKLIRRGRPEEAATSESAVKNQSYKAGSKPPPAPRDLTQVTSLPEASLHLAEDPSYLSAVRILISQIIRLLQPATGEAANKASEN